eukprot:275774-Rhodomonas_salina.1
MKASWAIMKATSTALLGHVGTPALSASSIAELWMSPIGTFTDRFEPSTLLSSVVLSCSPLLFPLSLPRPSFFAPSLDGKKETE